VIDVKKAGHAGIAAGNGNSIYQERDMGLLLDNAEGYKAGSPISLPLDLFHEPCLCYRLDLTGSI
jgi:hypothetical protein